MSINLSRTALASLFILPVLCWSQEFRATVAGHVLDATGAAIGNVVVQVLNLGTNEKATAVTDNQGTYTVPFLKPGTYRVTVEAPGFKKFIRDNITLNVGQAAGIDIALEVGQQTESITVTAESAVLETQTADRGLVIDQKRVVELPLNARNPFMLSILSAGVNFNGNQIYQRPFDNGAIADWSVNGGLNRKNEFLLDGAPNNAQAGGNNIAYVPPVDSVEEFKIQINSYDSQYGKTAGGIINVSLKSGTNQLHGTGYEFMRRNPLDANSFQNNARGVGRNGHFLDQYGGALGGPVLIPKLYDGRNRSFFFVNYEGYREGTPTPLNLSVPATEFINGDFSKLVDAQGRQIVIYDPVTGRDINGTFTRQAFPGNIIPKDRLNPIAQKILSYFPKPNISTPGFRYSQNNYFGAGGENLDKDDFYNLVIKLDQNFGANHHVFFRHASNDRTEIRGTNGVQGPGEDGQLPLKRVNDAYVIDWVGTLKPTTIANARFSVSRYIEGSRGDGNRGFDPVTLGFSPSLIRQLPVQGFFGRYEFDDYSSLGRYYSFNYTNTVALHPTLTRITGPHAIKSGVDMRFIQYNDQNVGNAFRFTNSRTFTQQQFNRGDALSGNSIANFLLGTPTGGNIDSRVFPSFLYRYFAPYIQDDWKVTRRLTLNLGLRWDFNISPKERYNRLDRSFDPVVTNPIDSAIDRRAFPGYPTVRGGLLFAKDGEIAANTDWTGIQPRIGFAYQISSKMVLRGGFGRYMINPDNDFFRTEGFNLTTNLISSQDGNRTAIPNLLNNPFPLGVQRPPGSSLGLATSLGRAIDFFDPTFKLPYANQFSLGIQYELPWQSQLDVSYVGNRGYKLQTARPSNDPPLAFRQRCNLWEGGNPLFCDELVPNPFANLPQFEGTNRTNPTLSRNELARPLPAFGGLNQRGRNDGKLWFNGMELTYNIRAKAGLHLTFAYTLSKSVEQGGFTANGNDANNAFQDTQRFIPERSLTTYDRPHVFKVSTVYELPFGRGKRLLHSSNPVFSRLVSGWTHTMIFQYSSGAPWDLPGGVLYAREAKLPDINWRTDRIQGVRPCVSKVQDNGSITLQPFSSAVQGCTVDTANFIVQPRYAPRTAPLRDGRLRLDAQPQFDMSVLKSTQITERVSFQFGAEAFNVFNRFWILKQQFNNNPEDSNFGSITKGTVAQGNANFPRQIQLRFKLVF